MDDERIKYSDNWNNVSNETRRARELQVERIERTYLELIQKQVESIARYLLLTNAGAAAAVLTALAQGNVRTVDFRAALSCFVAGIAITGLAMAVSFFWYETGANVTNDSFRRHVAGELNWLEFTDQLKQENWTGSRKFMRIIAKPLYWFSFACFLAGCSFAAVELWGNPN
jgi:hypothetical protein